MKFPVTCHCSYRCEATDLLSHVIPSISDVVLFAGISIVEFSRYNRFTMPTMEHLLFAKSASPRVFVGFTQPTVIVLRNFSHRGRARSERLHDAADVHQGPSSSKFL